MVPKKKGNNSPPPQKKSKQKKSASQASKQGEKPEAVVEVKQLSEDLHVCSQLTNYRTPADCRTSEAPNSSNQQPSINFRGNSTPLWLEYSIMGGIYTCWQPTGRKKKSISFERKKTSLSINMTTFISRMAVNKFESKNLSFFFRTCALLFFSQIHNFDFKAVSLS